MGVEEFRKEVNKDSVLLIEGKKYKIRQLIKFRFDGGGFYIKCFLSDSYVFADDSENNAFLLVKEVKASFKEPFPENLVFDGKNFVFLYTAHAVAEEIWGEEIFKKGEGERFWDYKAGDGSYLSLGITDEADERLDFYGKVIKREDVSVK